MSTTFAYYSGTTTTYTTSPLLGASVYTVPIPVLDYSSRDYETVLQDLVNRIPLYLPEWTSQSPSDFGIVLLQMFAYTVDVLGYYLDRLAGEAFIQTATQPTSVINLAAMLDYTPSLAVSASTMLQITISPSLSGPVTIFAGTRFETVATAQLPSIIFETQNDLTLPTPSLSLIGFVEAVQGITGTEQIGTSDGTVNQAYPLQYNPVGANSFSVFVQSNPNGGLQEWAFVSSLVEATQFEAAFTNFVDANGIFFIVFGDGTNGLIPPVGAPIYCTYTATAGSIGNVGAGTITQSVQAIMGLASVTNPLGATGGADPESMTSIQQNAPASLRTLNRAITPTDYETLATQVAGVQWASAIMMTYQLVWLYICPSGTFPQGPSTDLTNAVLNFMQPLAMAPTTIMVQPPTFVSVNITVQVTAFSNYENASVTQAVQASINNLLSLTNTGFGFRVSLGLVYQVVLAIPGVNYCFVTLLNRQMMTTTTVAVSGAGNTTLTVTPLPQQINAGDQITINNNAATPVIQTLTVTTNAPAGATTISVTSFTASVTYPIGSTIKDLTQLTDAVMLQNEIPVLGTLNVTTTGGLIGS